MALVFQQNEIDVERTGQFITVPNNDVARLMYYLKCVCDAVECDDDSSIQCFTNYRNWASLSFEEQEALVTLCNKLNPDVLDKRVFFHSEELCGDSSNEFYTINQVRNRIVAAESIIIAGRVRHVSKIMTYTRQWMTKNYYGPKQRLAARLSAPPQRPALTYTQYIVPQSYAQQYQPHAYTPLVAPQYYAPPRSNRNKWICGIVAIVIIVAIIYSTLFRRQ